jgi:hypothetical protein
MYSGERTRQVKVKKLALTLILIFLAGCFLASSVQSTKALGDVRLVSHSSFYNTINTLWVVGEVENTGDMATQYVKISAAFYNSTNELVATGYGYTSLDVVLPGRKSPFDILLSESEGSLKVHNYSLTVSWDDYAMGKPIGLEILSNSSYIDAYGYMIVDGEIKNTGNLVANYTEVIATFYDADGTVVGCDFDYTDPTHLAPSQTATFKINLIYTQQVMKVASYSLTAESMQYAIIPEFPAIITLPLFIVLTLLALVFARKSFRRHQ